MSKYTALSNAALIGLALLHRAGNASAVDLTSLVSGAEAKTLQTYAACLVKTRGAGRIDAFLATDPYSRAAAKFGQRVMTDKCLDGGEIEFEPVLLRAAIYDALYRRDRAAVVPGSLSDRAPLAPEDEVPQADGPLTDDYVIARRFGECVARAAPSRAHFLILSDADTPAEAAAAEAIKPFLADCITAGGTLRLNRPMLRGILAEALLKLIQRAPAPPQPPTKAAEVPQPALQGSNIKTQLQMPAGVDDVVITAKPGPPIWHVIKGDSDVVIFGTIAPLPKDLVWSQTRLAAGITGARRILISPEPSSGLVWSENFTASKVRLLRLPAGETIHSRLNPDLMARYDRAMTLGKLRLTQFDRWNAGIVGLIVLDHARRSLGLTTAEPAATIRSIARRQRVRAVFIQPRAGIPTLDRLPDLSAHDQVQCLTESLNNLDHEQAQASQLARAWAVGDVAFLRKNYERPRACEDLLAGDANRRQRATLAMLDEIIRDLALPGRTVALVDLSILFDPAFLARLRADGAEVRPPVHDDVPILDPN